MTTEARQGDVIEALVPPTNELVKVSYARHFDPAVAARRCVEDLGPERPALLLVFCGGKHEPERVREVFAEAYADVPIVGGSAAGAIAFQGFGYSGLEIAVMAFMDPAVTPAVHVEAGLLDGEWEAGHALGRRTAAAAADGALVLLLFDSVASSAPPRLHFASSIVAGFQAGLAGKRVALMGGGLLTDINLSAGWVYVGHSTCKHAAVALVFPPAVFADSVVLNGCRPVSTFMEITRIEGAVVYEIDHRPALCVIEERLGLTISDAADSNLTLIATLGEKQGDPFAPFDERAYVNRLILRSDRDAGSVTLFEPDFKVGTQVQIMSRDNVFMLQSVREGVMEAHRAMAAGDTLFNLYIDCAGRASAMSGAATEEAEILLRALDRSVPLLGFYSGVEVASYGNYSRPLDWTGLLLTVRRRGG